MPRSSGLFDFFNIFMPRVPTDILPPAIVISIILNPLIKAIILHISILSILIFSVTMALFPLGVPQVPLIPIPSALIVRLNTTDISINILITLSNLLKLIPHILIYFLIPRQKLVQSTHLRKLRKFGSGLAGACGGCP